MSKKASFGCDLAFFVALMASAVALGGALAHAFELPNKIGLAQEQYFIVQQAYRGWSLLGVVLSVQFTGILAVIIIHRRTRAVLVPALIGLASLIAAQAVFWVFTFPANAATQNWTVQPANWEALRAQWEYSHLAGAALQLIVMAALAIAVLRRPQSLERCRP
ncbi:MAG: DUF1772 domain-containing protein [Reyranellaceae bacterium]